jgi:hypothetical protein
MEYQERDRKLSASDALRALVYGIDGLIPSINRTYTKRKAAQARNILLEVQELISEGIANGTEAR